MAPKIIRLFIAEDSPTTAASLKTILMKGSDIEIVGEAVSGRETVERVKSIKPDLVLMDIGLPGLSGLDATRDIKKDMPDIKIIMVTSNDSEQSIFEAFSCGADGYFMKSNTEQLLQAVRSVNTGAAWLHPAIAGRVLSACVKGAARLEKAMQPATAKDPRSNKQSKHQVLNRLLNLADRLESSGEHEDLDAVLDGAHALCEQQEIDKGEYADLLTRQADILYEQENFNKAEKLYLKALDLRHNVLGHEHVDVAASLENLANLYDTRSSYAEAEHYYFWSLKIREKISGPEDPVTAETCSKLSWVLRAQGKLDLAEEMDKKAKKN